MAGDTPASAGRAGGDGRLKQKLVPVVGAAVTAWLLRLPTLEEPPADAALPKSGDPT